MKKVLVLGKGKSGLATKNLLQSKGYSVVLVDDADSVFCASELASFCFAVSSPGFSPTNKWIVSCKKAGLRVVSELDLGLAELKTNNVVAVTGTNGKTTIVSLIGEILKQEKTTFLLGNIGVPLCSKVGQIKTGDFVVLEISSFMLEQSKKLKPKIAIISNISPDHVEWHGSKQNYIKSKLKILSNPDGVAVVDASDPFLPEYKKVAKCKLLFVSTVGQTCGCYVANNNIFFCDGNINELVANKSDIKLVGNHNLKNVLMAICVAKLCGISNQSIKLALNSFALPKHRISFVATIKGIEFVNDSKSTNIDSTIKAVETFEGKKIILLVGGYDKGLNVSDMFKKLASKTKSIITFGGAGARFLKVAIQNGCKNVKNQPTLKNAFDVATKIAKKGDIVLFSPACSSFDEFESYEQRGEYFEQLVKEFEGNQTTKTAKTTI